MSNFKQDIIEAVGIDIILAVQISKFDCYYDYDKERFALGNLLADQIISYEEALKVLDYEYSASYGIQDCHNIYMWSKDFVYYIHEYDGATWIESVPRNPT